MLVYILLSACAQGQVTHEIYNAPYDGKKFNNLEPFEDKSFWSLLKWKLNSFFDEANIQWPAFKKNPVYSVEESRSKNLKIIVVNHACVLIQLDGINILTDPLYSERASPVTWAGPKRVLNPGIEFDSLPPIDLVLVSHNHYDHMDIETLLKLQERDNAPILVGLKSKEYLTKAGLKNIVELDWWQDYQLKNSEVPKITFVPAQHWSARSLWDNREMLWGGFYIAGSKKVYFAGDTGYGKIFSMINEKLSAPDVALLPIGSYEPRWFMKAAHVNPHEAVQAMLDLGAERSIGIHFGTFKLTDEGIDDPKKDLAQALLDLKVDATRFIVPEFGKTY